MKKESVKLKICVFAPTYPRHDADPEVPSLRRSIRLLANRGHRLAVIAPSWRGLRSHLIDGVRVFRFRYAPARLETLAHPPGGPDVAKSPLFRFLALPYVLLGSLAFAYWARRERFDLVHVHWPFPHAPMAFGPARLLGIRVNIAREERAALFQTCDIYIHPSISDDHASSDAIDAAVAEALLHERPVIASAVRMTSDVIMHRQTGLLVPEKSEAALARAIIRLLEQPHLARKLGRAGREYAEWHFDWVRITDHTEEMYYRAMERSVPKPRPQGRKPFFAPVTS